IDRITYHLKSESPKGKLCNAGYKYAIVQADGNIVRCGQLADNFIGSIFKEDFRLFNEPSPCEADVCPCNEYTNIIDESESFDIDSHETKNEPAKREKIVLTASEKDKLGEFLAKSPKFPRLDPPYRVYWNWDITYECNYKCSYCIFWKEHKERYPYVEIDKCRKIWDGIFEKYGCCHIRLSGGEPFVYPHFIELIAMLSKKHTVDVTTNLSFNTDLLLRNMPPGGITLSASFHPEFTDIDEFLDKVVLLNEKGFPTSIAFVAYPPHLKDLKRYKSAAEKRKVFDQTGVLFKIIPFIGEFEGQKYPGRYSVEQKKLLDEAATNTEIESQRELNAQWLDQGENEKFKQDKWCRMGQMYAKILPDGTVTRCCHHESDKLGSIFDKDFRLLDEPAACKVDSCACWKPMLVGYKEDKYPIFWEMPEHKIYKLEKP
ncbi:MAG: radical SAM protein, partial [bacterium]